MFMVLVKVTSIALIWLTMVLSILTCLFLSIRKYFDL